MSLATNAAGINRSPIAEMAALGFTSEHCPRINQVMPNVTRSFDGFHISYARHLSAYGTHTTALVLGGRVFFVLNGHHTSAMVEAALNDGVQGCIDVFIARIAHANALSEHRAAVGAASDPFDLRSTTLQLIGQENIDRIAAVLDATTDAAA